MAVQNPQKPPWRNPWDQSPAVPQPQIRLTHADRDAVAEVLREAYSQGQLDEDEFGERLDRSMRAKVSADLVPLTADLGVRVSPGGAGGQPRTEGGGSGRASEPTTDNPLEKVGAAAGHLSAWFLPFVAPLVLLLVGGELSPYLRRQAMEALNFQLFGLISVIASVLLIWLVLPALVLVGVFLGWLILPLMAAAMSLMGRSWKYPLIYRLIKDN
ncbi:DUF1707 and DUF4870 domain-containing protein [Nocardiopsis sp. NPDC006938]|uniref:DUF1707 and DUF4870 domain-containing protein n=1 Tax=Nocardiopsis sp. NPDC006938 TaxID=3364337 RepID=UPI0036BE35DB